ncbi:MAG TPA: hypothetical protein VKY65_12965 [Alphaproteobacteria bacterium]|nr:hypothetical protein [Alphaproteobacteria bacterium]
MPSVCHPIAPHKKLTLPEWYVSSLMLDRALDAILRRVRKLDRAHDIPYLAGYSLDGKTIYIDRHLPKVFAFHGREIEVDRYLILHEEVEKTLIDQLGLHYLHAHQIATRAEQAAIRADRINWHDYDRFMQKYVKRIGDERLTKVPADLDLKPYRDEHDLDVLRRIETALDKGRMPYAIREKGVRASVHALERETRAKPAATVRKGKLVKAARPKRKAAVRRARRGKSLKGARSAG